MHKDLRKVVKELQRQGFTTRTTTKGHVVVYCGGQVVTTISGTPGDSRAILNALAAARRFGFVWPPVR